MSGQCLNAVITNVSESLSAKIFKMNDDLHFCVQKINVDFKPSMCKLNNVCAKLTLMNSNAKVSLMNPGLFPTIKKIGSILNINCSIVCTLREYMNYLHVTPTDTQ